MQLRSKIFLLFFILLSLIFGIYIFRAYLIVNSDQTQQSIKFYDRNDELIYEQLASEQGYSTYANLNDIDRELVELIVKVEDKRYYSHFGIDFWRLFGCVYKTTIQNEICGASTIEQQYLKNVLGNSERSILSKLDELALASTLNIVSNKDVVLEKYLNTIYFGNLVYGIEGASQVYFSKTTTDLDFPQKALLVVIPNSPDKYNPYRNLTLTKERQANVMQVLADQDLITPEELQSLENAPLDITKRENNSDAPHFVDFINSSLGSNVFLQPEIYTTLDSSLNSKISQIVNSKLQELEHKNANNAAVVVLDVESGDLVAMVGSSDYYDFENEGQVNTSLSLRSPGSTIKSFIYAFALEEDYTLATQIEDKVQVIPTFDGKEYIPRNYDLSEHSDVDIRKALSNSYNIPAVIMLRNMDMENVYEKLELMGIEEAKDQGADLATSLGGFGVSLLDLTNAYRTFANKGQFVEGINFQQNLESSNSYKIDAFGEDSEAIAYLIYDVLSDYESRRDEFGTLNNFTFPFRIASKTGTSTDFKDSVAVGFTKKYVVGVWVGNNDNSKMVGVNGSIGAGSIWNEVVEVVNDYYITELGFSQQEMEIEKPDGIVEEEYCVANFGRLDDCPTKIRQELFLASKTPKNGDLKDYLGVFLENLIGIESPANGEGFYVDVSDTIEITYVLNGEFEKVVLVHNGEELLLEPVRNKYFYPKIFKDENNYMLRAFKENEIFESSVIQISGL